MLSAVSFFAGLTLSRVRSKMSKRTRMSFVERWFSIITARKPAGMRIVRNSLGVAGSDVFIGCARWFLYQSYRRLASTAFDQFRRLGTRFAVNPFGINGA